MNKKILFLIPLLGLLLVSGVMACFVGNSFRGTGGNINYIGTDINPVPANVQLSYWANYGGSNGQGSLELIAKTLGGKRIVLNMNMRDLAYYSYIENGVQYLHFEGNGNANYWKQGIGLKQVVFSVNGNLDTSSMKTTISGFGNDGTNFQITDIVTKTIA